MLSIIMSLCITRVVVLFPVMLLATFTTTESLALPGCPGECGNLSIPFPFGITSDCYLDDSFLIICNRSYNPPKPFLDLGHAEVLSISLDGKIKILNSSTELMEVGKRDRESLYDPVVIEWAAGNVACHTAKDNAAHYACQSKNSKCTDSSIGRGHICHCLAGYEGNPYLPDGCQDIDECAILKPCEHVCINFPGSFKCYCPEGLTGDGRKDGSGCHPKYQFTQFVSVPSYLLGIIVLAPAIAGTWIIWIHNEKKLLKHREKVFEQNGGISWKRKVSMLKEQAKKNTRLYTADDMRKATNNYGNQIVYKGRPGTCYLGRLPVNGVETKVVVMKIPSVPSSQRDHFIDELIFLSQPHKNLVKIIGCCLETESPLLVYEFHGERCSLFDQGHEDPDFLGEQRVKVAAGVSRGLAYLHSKNSRPIVHGNVSSSNIFLYDSNEAKLFYDAASNFTPQDSSDQENSVHRSPEISSSGSGQRSQKSDDVYNFGIVLAELLPGWKTIAPTKNKSVKEDIAKLAAKCLSEKRPKMKEVEAKLITLTNQR